MAFNISWHAYVEMVDPTKGNRVRFADTELFIEIEKEFTTSSMSSHQ